MSDFKMTATPPLDGYAKKFDGVRLTEITGRAIVSIATPTGGDEALAKSLKKAFNTSLPEIGKSQNIAFNSGLLLGMQPRQALFIFKHDKAGAVDVVAGKLGETAYLSDQSDSFVMMRITGDNARSALERICPIDLHPDAFSIGRVARTSMEHLSVIIVREAEDTFLLMSPRSSARSFLQALETSIYNVS